MAPLYKICVKMGVDMYLLVYVISQFTPIADLKNILVCCIIFNSFFPPSNDFLIV